MHPFLDEMSGSIPRFGVNVASEKDDDNAIIIPVQSKISEQVHLGFSFFVYDYKTILNTISK